MPTPKKRHERWLLHLHGRRRRRATWLQRHDDARRNAPSVDGHECYDSSWGAFMAGIKAAGRGGAHSSPRRGGHRLYVDAVVGAAARVLPATVLGATRRYDRALWLQVGGTTQWSSTDGEEPAAAVLVERGSTEIAVASARAAGLHPGFALTTGSRSALGWGWAPAGRAYDCCPS